MSAPTPAAGADGRLPSGGTPGHGSDAAAAAGPASPEAPTGAHLPPGGPQSSAVSPATGRGAGPLPAATDGGSPDERSARAGSTDDRGDGTTSGAGSGAPIDLAKPGTAADAASRRSADRGTSGGGTAGRTSPGDPGAPGTDRTTPTPTPTPTPEAGAASGPGEAAGAGAAGRPESDGSAGAALGRSAGSATPAAGTAGPSSSAGAPTPAGGTAAGSVPDGQRQGEVPAQPGVARPAAGGGPTPPPPAHAPGAGHPGVPGNPPPGGTPAVGTPPAGPPGDGLRRYDPWGAVVPPLDEPAPATDGAGRPRRGVLIAGAVAIALAAGLIGGGVGVYLEREGQFSEVRLPQAAGSERAAAEPGSIAGIAEAALPGVVTLHVRGGGSAGTGTGFVIDDRGHILTNAHVVRPAVGTSGSIQVTFNSGDTASAEIVGQDAGYDLAVVKVTGVSGLTPLPLGDSDSVRVGDPVVAIGAPFDLAGTVTSGIISAVNRPITAGGEESDGSDISYVNALQTDAPINPGNSGGPLVDLDGRVIGINSAIRAPESGGAEGGQAGSVGLGFAIPINQGKDIAEQLINTGRATHPVIGVTLDLSYRGTGARIGTAAGNDSGTAVEPGGPGDLAGLREGDVITAVNGERVRSGDELIVRIRSHRPGDALVLSVQRDGEDLEVPVTLGEASGG
nr:trypsin-like peptidase domain-containing protein [Streptomyces sp. AA0539]